MRALVLAFGIAAAATTLATAAAPKSAPPRRAMTVDDLWSMQRVGAPALSPDGRWAAFAVTTFSKEENKGDSDLWLVPTDASAPARRLTFNVGTDASPTWSPDGTRLAFVSKRGDNPAQIHVLPISGGEAEAVTAMPVAASDPRWFPDGKRIAFLAATWPDLNGDLDAVKKRLEEQKKDKTKAQASESRAFRYWDHALTDSTVTHVFAVDLDSRGVRDLFPGWSRWWDFEGAEGYWDLAPDGSEIVWSANATDLPHRTLNFDLWAATLHPNEHGFEAGTPRNLTADHPADDLRPRYTRDGRRIVFGRGRRVEVDPDFIRLAVLDRTTGVARELAPDWDASPSAWTQTPDGTTILFHAQERGRTHLYAIPAEGGTPRIVVRGGNTAGAAAGPRGVVVYTRDTMTEPAELQVTSLTGKSVRPLTAFNAARVAVLDLGTVRDVTFPGAGGAPVQMFVVLPPGFDAARRWPLLQVIHGGPHGASLDQFHYRWNAALLASQGHVVALVNFHGSTGFGQSFAESILGAHGDKPFDDIMRSTDWLIAQGYVDETRMAAAGGSYGGYLVDWILGHTDRFAALVSHAGVYDLMAQFASDATWGRSNNYGATPWEDPARIDRWSPNRFAAHFKTPTLVLHGEKDFRVPVTQGIELHGVLTAKGVPSRLVIFPDENHWILKPQSAARWWSELFAWLDRYAGPRRATGAAPGTATGGAGSDR